MRITESQLRLIIRQELLTILEEKQVLSEGRFSRFIAPLAVAAGLAGTLGGAASQSGKTLGDVSRPESAISYAITAPTKEEIKQLSPLVQEQLKNLRIQGDTSTIGDFTYDKNTKELTFRGSKTKINPEVQRWAEIYMTKDTSSSSRFSSSERDTWLVSDDGEKFRQAIAEIVNENPKLEQAVGAGDRQTLLLSFALMLIVIGTPVSIAASQEPDKRRR